MALDVGELQATINVVSNTSGGSEVISLLRRIAEATEKTVSVLETFSSSAQKSFAYASDSAKKAQKGYIEFFGTTSKSAEESARVFELNFKRQEQAQRQAEQANKAAIRAEKEAIKQRTIAHKQGWAEIIKSQEDASKKLQEDISKNNSADVAAKKLEQAFDKQTRTVEVTEQRVERLALSYKQLEGGQKYASQVTNAFNEFRLATDNGRVSTEKFRTEQGKLNVQLEKIKTGVNRAHPELSKFQIGLTEMSKTAVIALGPLNGVASRITALSSIAKASALPIAALFGGLAGFAVLMGKSVKAGAAMEAQLFKMTNALNAFGNQTGMTAVELDAIAISLAKNTLTSTALAREAAVLLQAFSGVGGKTEELLYLAQDLTAVMGGSLLENTKRLGQVMENPVRALENLGESGVRFSAQQKEVIRSLVLTGQSAKASAVILNEISDVRKIGGAGSAEAKGLAGAWDTLVESITRFIESVGGAETQGGTLASTIINIAKSLEHFSRSGGEAERIGRVISSVLNEVAGAALWAAENLRLLIDAYFGFIAGGLAYKVAKGLYASAAAAEAVAIKAGIAAKGLAAFSKAARIAMLATGVGIITVVASLAAEYLLFSESADEAAKSQSNLNKSMEEAAKISPPKSRGDLIGDQLASLDKFMREMSLLYVELANKRDKAFAAGGSTAALEAEMARVAQQIQAAGKATQDFLVERKKLDTEASLKGTKDQVSEFEALEGTIIRGANAQKKFNDVVALSTSIDWENVASLVAKGQITQDVADRLKHFRDTVTLLGSTNGFVDVFNSVVDLNTAFAQSNVLLNAVRQGGINAGIALEHSFNKQALIEKYRRSLIGASEDSLKYEANLLGVKYVAGDLAGNIKRISEALATTESETTKNNQSLERYRQLLSETTELTDRIAVAKVGSGTGGILDQIFNPAGIARAKEFEADVINIQHNLEAAMVKDDFTLVDTIEKYSEVAAKAGMADPFKNIDPTNVEEVSKGVAKVKQGVKDLEKSPEAIVSAFSTIASQFGEIMATMSNAYAEMASYHAQMAKEALDNGRSQAELYMQLADAVHYSNNQQAQAYEQRAMVAAESAAAEYHAQQALREKSNAAAKKAFENQKKLQIAQAIMSTALAVMQTYTSSGLGIYATPLAVAMGALGAVQVGMIQQQSYTPRKDGGSIYGSKSYVVGEEGPEVFVPGRSGTVLSQRAIMDGLTNGGGSDGINITFNIETADASGFDRWLTSRRATIINMIRDATNNEMRESPV